MKKKFKLIIVFGAIISSINFCRSSPPSIIPEDNNVSVIGLEMKINIQYYPDLFPTPPLTVYLVKEKDGKSIFNQTDLIEASHKSYDRFYFLNLQPGKYSIIGCKSIYVISAGGTSGNISASGTYKSEFNVAFSESIIKFGQVEVKPNNFYYIGEYNIHTKSYSNDDSTKHYHALFYPPEQFRNNFPVEKSFLFGYEDEKDNSEKLKEKFLKEAKKDFEKTPWVRYFEN